MPGKGPERVARIATKPPESTRPFLYSGRVSRRSDREERNGDAERRLGAIPSGRPPLRRGLFGYRAEDVDQAFEARDTELAELRQDVAALWLAFSQHDRLIRAVLAEPPSSPAPPAPAPAPPESRQAPAAEAAPINRQLEELDQVLAAIESATQTLERTYAEETGATGEQTNVPGAPAAGGGEAAAH